MDQTIREGEDTPDVLFSTEAKFEILDTLEDIGVKETEVGYVGAIDEQREFMIAAKKRGTNLRLGSHNRAYTRGNEWKEEIDRTVDAGADIVDLVIWMSEALSVSTPWLKDIGVPERMTECIEYCNSRGVETCVLVADLFRSKLPKVVELYDALGRLKVDRMYVTDGTGNVTPEAMQFMVRFTKQMVGQRTKIALHTHNEFGLSLCNALAGVKAGAEVVDVTINGLGHNCGITALEELAATLTIQYGLETGIDIGKLYQASKLVERLSGQKLYPNKAVVGENMFRHQLDSHIANILRGVWFAWDNIRPDVMGRSFRLEWAKGRLRRGRSGSIDAKLDQLGLVADDAQFDRIMTELRGRVNDHNVNEPELEQIIRSVVE